MDPASQLATILGVPLAAVPVGVAVHSGLKGMRANSKIKKWAVRINDISRDVVASQDYLSNDEMNEFVQLVEM